MTRYQNIFLQLLPTGPAWNKVPESTLARLAGGLADSPEQDAATIDATLNERFPDTSLVLLDDWEKWLDLPDCSSGGQTIPERRLAAAEKLRMVGSLNKDFYIELAAKYGFEITISPDPGNGKFTSQILVKNDLGYRNATVLDNCLTPLRIYSAGVLECLFEKYKPAHQVFNFIYS